MFADNKTSNDIMLKKKILAKNYLKQPYLGIEVALCLSILNQEFRIFSNANPLVFIRLLTDS